MFSSEDGDYSLMALSEPILGYRLRRPISLVHREHWTVDPVVAGSSPVALDDQR